jgi:TRAP-type C4-dicarboxylate transport system permease small subunit
MNDNTPPVRASDNIVVRWLHRFEDGLLILALLAMIGMAVFQIVLRIRFHTGIVWGDEFVRVLVLWLGLLGAVSASRTDRHIRIDLASRYLPRQWRAWATALMQLATALVCGLAAWYAVQFVKIEFEYPERAFAAVPTWVCEIIIPVGFAAITLRYIILSVNQIRVAVKKTS